ncbi:hypothetical protein EVJ58_g9307 [Rhodofomes roseus]|uniref:Uncharacterized protein n=1 Tax=Rhodofomes roseus TaxID=34475 RepID=A0A4Y9XWG0_9APHY|nr:hypothetical protein EVJ58_g9307 [Rhodofomes roseus]
MEDMTRYLDSVVTKLDDALVWLQSVEGKDHIRTSNETIRDMHLSLRRFSCRKVCAPDAAPSAPFPVPEFGGHMMPILPDCRGLCEPYFGLKGWPQNFEHMHSIDLNALPDWTLRDRNWVPMSVPLEEYIVQRRELRRQRDATQKCTTSPLQRFLVSTSRDSPIDIPPTSCRRPPVAPTSTDTGYVSGPPGTLLDDTDTSRSASTSDSKKRRRLVDEPAGSSLSEAGATVSESPRDTKRIRRHYSWPNDIPPPPRRTIRRRFTTPAPLSVTCVSPSADEAMDVDRESSDALSGPTQFGPPGLDDSSGDGSSISASDVLDETEVAQRDTSAERHDTPRWHGATAATDKPTDHHGPGPSTWLRKLWRIFGWRG